MARIYLDQQPAQKQAPTAQKKRVYLDQQPAPVQTNNTGKKRVYLDNKPAPIKEQSGGFWRSVGNQLIKPIASSTNAFEDLVKTLAYPVANKVKPGSFQDYSRAVGINPVQNQRDVWGGRNQRTFNTVMKEIADRPENVQNIPLSTAMRTIGIGGDLLLDPLNKLKIASMTQKGLQAAKQGKQALSVAEQAQKGERALLQFGNTNILPSLGNKVLEGSTRLNDAVRGTKYGAKLFDAGSKVSTKIRPTGVERGEWKTITDAKRSASKSERYNTEQSLKLATDLEKTLRNSKADDATRSALLHAAEKGDASLVPAGLEEAFQKAINFKTSNEALWKEYGGSTLEGYGLAHVATPEVAEASRKKSLSGGKLFSPMTPQDNHRQWVKVDGEITNLENAGIKYDKKTGFYMKNFGKETADGNFANKWEPVNVEQATAREINEALGKQGKGALFQENLPLSVARMGISTGKKKAGMEFMRDTAGVTSEKGKEVINETYQKLTNIQAVNKAIKLYDKALGVWKAQALVAPSYHIRNEVGNVWNNYLAGVTPVDMITAAKLQSGKGLKAAEKQLIEEMEKQGVIGSGWYGADIAQEIGDRIGGASINPVSQRFGLYKGNKAVGEAFENNARMAHYLAKRRDGYSAVEAAKSVDKFLFDYGELTEIEQQIFKRALPFYTWASKNLPLQIEQFVKNPGKFAKAAVIQKDREEGVEKPNEKYLNDYIKTNSPMRFKTNADGSTSYLLLGQWLPAASAFQFLSQPPQEIARSLSPIVEIGGNVSDVLFGTNFNKTSFFKNTLGEPEKAESFPGELKSFLGFDMGVKTANVLRGIRVLNEIDKLNPGLIFGGKDTPSIFKGLPNASESRGSRFSPDSTQAARTTGFLVGKTQNYDVEQSKFFYDRDTDKRMQEYNTALLEALRHKQPEMAKEIIAQMEAFQQEREGKPNKNVEQYNLMGDRALNDIIKDKAAEILRDDTRKKMREQIRQGIETNNDTLIKEAMLLDPTYAKDALKDAVKEKGVATMSDEDKRLLYEVERMKTEKRLSPFYK